MDQSIISCSTPHSVTMVTMLNNHWMYVILVQKENNLICLVPGGILAYKKLLLAQTQPGGSYR